jgi:NAD(P)-dependent dehydrogenase (short-subunit alcohol dehydrogenase family)
MGELNGRVVCVTGGNGGIGLGMAEACAAAGADVAVWGTNPDKNAAAEAQLKELGRQVVALQCDVGEEDQVAEAFAATVARLGKVDACFANAGIDRMARFTDMSLDLWRQVTRVNLDGAFLTLREAARHMVERGEGGALVAISSVSAIHGAPMNQAYAASKAGVNAVIRGLAVELARYKIRCNSILPGWIDTDMTAPGKSNQKFVDNTTNRTPLRRWGQPGDLGAAAVFLANPDHLFHTGDCLVVDGGYSIF